MDILERFLSYVKVETTSYEDIEKFPSTVGQLNLAKALKEEMEKIGLSDVHTDEYGYTYGFLPATDSSLPAMGLIAHVDTAEAVSGKDVKPRVFCYNGGDIALSEGIVTKVSSFPFLNNYVGQTLVVTDGKTLLGADDKAGVAEIMTAVEYLNCHKEIKHGKISVAFTPEEETGRGTDHFDLEHFDAKFAYTVDGGALGELEYENFNAANAFVHFNGVNIHPGSAKNKMKNAVLIAAEFISMMPDAETPSHTEGYEGFYHVSNIEGNETSAKLRMIIRDHDRAKFEKRKEFVKNLCEYINKVYGEGTAVLEMKDSYYNMREVIEKNLDVVKRAEKAFFDAGVTPKTIPIRGGTDGARLSFMGLPCPNLSTGGENFHGIHELVSVDAMKKMVEVIVNICKG